ncbi:prephenate dehydrogenase [Candidatus Woesearchaeota archaeon]|nr:prephenate dehydrogenase [Candidatus Woesearchaeota archaeon]|tara:strand:- start:3992 stop:4720 length:729 start_codon:yes stop_codon:yes gene_type:complete
MKIGIIAFGRFGKLITKYLAKDFEVFVYTRKDKSKEIKEMNATPASLDEVCAMDVIIPCVPISEFENILEKIKDFVKKESLIADVCSVKEYPAELMKKILPQNIHILGTHPLFGPDSAFDSLEGEKIVLCKVRIPDNRYKSIKSYLVRKGLTIIEATSEDHDKEISKSLLLPHFIGRSLMQYGAKEMDIDTEGYKRLLRILKVVENDTWKLFEDINRYNKYSKKERENFIRSMVEINRRLEK